MRLGLVLCCLCAAPLLGSCATTASPEAAMRIDRDLVYAQRGDGNAVTADLFRPATMPAPRPAVVVVHGGGWQRGDREEMEHIVRALVAQGYVVLNIGYRLAPRHPYPAAVDDLHDALRWLAANAQRFGVDRERIALWGYSAGAHLAGLVAARPPADLPPIAAAILGGTPADLVRAQNSELVQQFLGGTISTLPQRYVEASPLQQVSARSAPMLLYHGSWDLIVWPQHSRDLHARLQAVGVDSEYIALPARGHIAAFFLDGAAKRAAMAFLQRHFGEPLQTVQR